MACRTRNVKEAAIYNVVNNLIKNPDLTIETMDDVINWFSENYPSITPNEIITSLVLTDERVVDASKVALRKKKSDIVKEAKHLNKVGLFLENMLEKHVGTKTEDSKAAKQVKSIFKKFKDLAAAESVTTDDIEEVLAMVESLPGNAGYDATKVQLVIDNLKGLAKQKAEERDAARIKRMSEKLDALFEGKLVRSKSKPRVPPSDEVQEFEKILKELYNYAADNRDISDIDHAGILERLGEINNSYKEFYEADPDKAVEAINNAIENYHELRKELKVESLQKRLAQHKSNIDRLDRWGEGGEVDITDLVTENTSTPWRPISNEINDLEHELEDAKEALENKIKRAQREIKIDNALKKLLGDYTRAPKTARNMLNFYYAVREYGWELPRTLSFMLDASMFGVQAMPILAMDLFSPISNIAKGRTGRIAGQEHKTFKGLEVFQGWQRSMDIFREGWWMILKEDSKYLWNNRSDPNSFKKTKGDWTRMKYEEIKNSPLYELMDKSGLRISRSKSLTNSEEYFKSALLNRVPIAGWIKDMSEDTMVTVLNMYRVTMFEQFYRNNPGLDLESYMKAAENINNITGTTTDFGQILGSAAVALSAPRLLYARLKLVGRAPVAAAVMAVRGSIKGYNAIVQQMGGKGINLREPDAANDFTRSNIIGGLSAIAGIYGMAAVIGVMFPNAIKVGGDWEDSDFLRIQIGSRSYDVTGGLGAIGRFLAQTYLYTYGAPEDASYSTKERINYLRNVKGFETYTALFNFIRTKLHPSISKGISIATGKDFMGTPQAFFGNVGDGWSRASAVSKLAMPISLETAFEDPTLQSVIPQWFGANVFQYEDKSKDFRAINWINQHEYRPQLRYPDELKKRDRKEVDKDALEVIYLKRKFSTEWGKALGNLIIENPDISKQQLDIRMKAEERRILKEFYERYGEDLKTLPLIKATTKKAK